MGIIKLNVCNLANKLFSERVAIAKDILFTLHTPNGKHTVELVDADDPAINTRFDVNYSELGFVKDSVSNLAKELMLAHNIEYDVAHKRAMKHIQFQDHRVGQIMLAYDGYNMVAFAYGEHNTVMELPADNDYKDNVAKFNKIIEDHIKHNLAKQHNLKGVHLVTIDYSGAMYQIFVDCGR